MVTVKKIRGFVRRKLNPTQEELERELTREKLKLKKRQTRAEIARVKTQSRQTKLKGVRKVAEKISAADIAGFGPIKRTVVKKAVKKRVKKRKKGKR